MTEAVQNRLIQAHMHLVPVVASEFRGGDVEFEELSSVAGLGLTEAARSYDPEKGTQFSTWAITRMRGAVLNFLDSNRVVLDVTSSDQIERVYDWDAWGRMGNAMAISEAWVSLESSPEDLAERFDALKDMRDRFDAAFISLTVNQRKLVKWVFLDRPAKSIPDAARELGTSYYRTARMLKNALATMRTVIVAMEAKTSGGITANGHPSKTGSHGRAPGTVAA